MDNNIKDCNVIVPQLIVDECNGCLTKDACVVVTTDLTQLGFETDQDLRTVISELIRRIKMLENN